MAKEFVSQYTAAEMEQSFSAAHKPPCAASAEMSAVFDDHRRTDYDRWQRAESYYKKIEALLASALNRTDDGQEAIDITAQAQSANGWTVDNELGGIVTVKVINHWNSSGILWINGAERYHSAGLYTSDTPIEASEIVEAGDVVRTENMTQVLFTPYRLIVV